MPRATDCTLNASAQQPSPGPGDGVVTGKVVLVPLDGSNNALCALPIAKRLADLARGAVRILHVTDEIRPLGRTAELLGCDRPTCATPLFRSAADVLPRRFWLRRRSARRH